MQLNFARNILLALSIALFVSLPGSSHALVLKATPNKNFSLAEPAAGTLDPSYGEGGLIISDMNSSSYGQAVALQTDGKIVAIGSVAVPGYFSSTRDFTLARYNPDGSLDTTFGVDGLVITDSSTGIDSGQALAIQSDGKIIVVGSAGTLCGIVRYDTAGSLDNTFGVEGKQTISNFLCGGIAFQSTSKIIVSGVATDEWDFNHQGFGLARLNSDGSLDTSFGVAGLVRTFYTDYSMFGNKVIIGSSDGIFIGGRFFPTYLTSEYAIAHYSSEGVLDTSFGVNGIVSTSFGGENITTGLILQDNAKILLAGYSNSNNVHTLTFVRFNDNGSLDTSFGTGGRSIPDLGGYSFTPMDMSLQSDGRFIIAGMDLSNFGLVRFTNDTSLDASFGIGGIVTTDLGNFEYGFGCTVEPSGRILLVGSTESQLNSNFALLRYLDDGNLDNSFDNDGIVITRYKGSYDLVYAMALQSNGQSVMAGASNGGNDFVALVSRQNLDGSLDETFGGHGSSLIPFGNYGSIAYAISIQPDQKLLVAGVTYNGPIYFDFSLARLDTVGSLDSSFGTGGMVLTDFAGGADGARDVGVQADGKILAIGYAWVNTDHSIDFALARYESDGTLDTSFGNTGKVTTDFFGLIDVASAFAFQQDGKIIVVGQALKTNAPRDYDLALARYNTDGTLDTTFGSLGKVTTDLGGDEEATAVALQEDGKILVTGESSDQAILLRYNPDGSLDTTFGNGGAALRNIGSTEEASSSTVNMDTARSILVQPDGKIMIGGDTGTDIALSRYNMDGTIDSTFGTNGVTITDLGGNDDECYALALQRDGKVLAAGYTDRNNNFDLAEARYFTGLKFTYTYLPLILVHR